MKIIKLILGALLLLGIVNAYGSEGQDRGGGDPCEDRIKVITSDIASWINRGGASGLLLPSGLQIQSYSANMLYQISQATFQCVAQGDQGYPVEVNGTAKVCRFDKKDLKSRVTCDFTKFQSLPETEQYTLIHHELAGLSGIENPNGDDSNYQVSNQISSFLVDTVVKRLAVLPRVSSNASDSLRESTKFAFWAAGLFYCFDSSGSSLELGYDSGYEAFQNHLLSDQKHTTFQLIKDKKRPRIFALYKNNESGEDIEIQVEFPLSKDLKSILSMTFVSGVVQVQTINTGTVVSPKYETQRYLNVRQRGYCRAASVQEGVFPK